MSGDDMEHRVAALEKSVGRIEDKLDLLIEAFKEFRTDTMVRFARIEEKLDQKASASELAKVEEKLEQKASASELAKVSEKLENRASAVELAEVKGRVNSLPTTFQMITLVFGILGGAFLILKFGLTHVP